MTNRRPPKEIQLYERVERFMRRYFACRETKQKVGTPEGAADIIGIRQMGRAPTHSSGKRRHRIFSTETELVAIEVKNQNAPFLRAVGQASAYRVFAHRSFLADWRTENPPFSADQIEMARALGVGLIAIRGQACQEIAAAPYGVPINHLRLEMLRSGFHRVECTLCSLLFPYPRSNMNRPGWPDSDGVKYPEWRERRPGEHLRFLCPPCTEALWSRNKEFMEEIYDWEFGASGPEWLHRRLRELTKAVNRALIREERAPIPLRDGPA